MRTMPASTDEILPSVAIDERTLGGNKAFHNFYNDYSHIADPNLRRRLALSEIDRVPFGIYHVRAILVAGVGFFLDSYDIFAINLITGLLGMVFWSGGGEPGDGFGNNQGRLPDPINQALKASTSTGIIIGMIVFGWLADAYGRRRMYGVELAIIIFGTFCCALVSSSPSISAAGLMIFWRIIMGIGIGGDYPLSSVITSEFAPTRWRGAMVAAVFSMQGLGQLFAALVALLTTIAFKKSFIGITDETLCDASCRLAADRSWRLIVGIGAIPACLALYYRITIPETPRYTFDVQLDVEKADADIRAYVSSGSKGEGETHTRVRTLTNQTLNVPQASRADMIAYFTQWKHLKVLIGTSMSWFFLDLAYYGLGLNNTIVLDAIGYADGQTLFHTLQNQAIGMIILACAGSIPGYWVAVFAVDTIGRKPLQILGFLILTMLFCIIGFMHDRLSEGSLLGLYIVCQFVFNAGPNTTTFIVAGECFPTRYRSTAHGISAAVGKLGAVLAQVISIPLLKTQSPTGCHGPRCSPHLARLIQLFALFMFLGMLVSFLIPETKGLTLEEISGETRTSYNAGSNGSIRLGASKARAWNPFHGGQPAGFSYSRDALSEPSSKKGRFTRRGPDGAQSTPMEGPRGRRESFWRRRRRTRAYSEDTDDIALSDRSSGATQRQTTSADVSSAPPTMEGQQMPLPAWGAGWGRVDRGRPSRSMNELQLNDVGMLLNEPA